MKPRIEKKYGRTTSCLVSFNLARLCTKKAHGYPMLLGGFQFCLLKGSLLFQPHDGVLAANVIGKFKFSFQFLGLNQMGHNTRISGIQEGHLQLMRKRTRWNANCLYSKSRHRRLLCHSPKALQPIQLSALRFSRIPHSIYYSQCMQHLQEVTGGLHNAFGRHSKWQFGTPIIVIIRL